MSVVSIGGGTQDGLVTLTEGCGAAILNSVILNFVMAAEGMIVPSVPRSGTER